MAEEQVLITETRYEAEKSQSFFENHPPIDLATISQVKEIPEAWSPPHLFIASVESCFLLTMLEIAKKMHINIISYSSTAEGLVVKEDGKHKEVKEITIRPSFHLEKESDRLRLKMLSEKAEEYCMVSRSIKTKIKVEM